MRSADSTTGDTLCVCAKAAEDDADMLSVHDWEVAVTCYPSHWIPASESPTARALGEEKVALAAYCWYERAPAGAEPRHTQGEKPEQRHTDRHTQEPEARQLRVEFVRSNGGWSKAMLLACSRKDKGLKPHLSLALRHPPSLSLHHRSLPDRVLAPPEISTSWWSWLWGWVRW